MENETQAQETRPHAQDDSTADLACPPAPNPSADPGVVPQINARQDVTADNPIPDADFEVGSLQPVVALKILARGVQVLSDMTGDVPATPPISRSSSPQLIEPRPMHRRTGSRPTTPPSRVSSADMVPTTMKDMPIGSPEAQPCEPEQIDHKTALRVQHDAISRKFFSKKPPPVSIHDYLLRLQRFCPMSTAVYLAACAYIHQLAVIEKTVPVTPRTSHRLVLSALRVGMKVLEDLNYPHSRFAGVGGVSEKELAKLEVSLCYVLNFDLRVGEELLHDRARAFQQLALATPKLTAATMSLKLPSGTRLPRQPVPFPAPAV
ncbi:MAG: hypothetical protein Q9162_001488 [Coniocarpon cinnabarinum]